MIGDLNSIRVKFRRLTGTPNQAQITDEQIDDYINTFYQFDVPSELRLAQMKLTLTFFTEPFKDVYPVDSTPGLVDFLNNYITVEPPVYIAGNLSYFTQSRQDFFNLYPIPSFRQIVATGDGVTKNFQGILGNVPIAQNSISFSSIRNAPSALGLVAIDQPRPFNNTEADLVDESGTVLGEINYITGVYNFAYINPPGVNEPVQIQCLPYRATLPTAMLFYGNAFTLRPIPNLPYKVTIDAFVKPTAFDGNPLMTPFLREWWEYLAYGAAKKRFEDMADPDSVANIMAALQQQQDNVLSRTLNQYSTKLPPTIYDRKGYNYLGWNSQSGMY